MKSLRAAASLQSEREGILAVLQEQSTIDRIQGVIRELQLDDELTVTDTLDAALRRIRSGAAPRILVVDLGESTAPIAEVSAARAVGGADLKLVVLGTVNDVALFRDLLSAGASDYLVKPSTREALGAALEKKSVSVSTTADGLGQVIVFIGSRGGVGATTSAVSCAWLLAAERRERIALVDLDLHFGTVALKLDLDPGSGLCEALEQPSRIDSLFIERAMIKVNDNLRVLAAEASAAQHLPSMPGLSTCCSTNCAGNSPGSQSTCRAAPARCSASSSLRQATSSFSANAAWRACAIRSGCRPWCASRRRRPGSGWSRRAPAASVL
jgi:pilus assembly protein CpaE